MGKRTVERHQISRQLALETLEPRVLLSTLHHGNTFDFMALDGSYVRAHLDSFSGTDDGAEVELLGINAGGTDVVDFPAVPNPEDETSFNDLWAIYFTHSTSDTFLSIAAMDDPEHPNVVEPNTGSPLPLSPGGDPFFLESLPSDIGRVFVGGTPVWDPESPDTIVAKQPDFSPLLTASAVGVFPGGTIYPGITVALDGGNPQNLGAAQIGGALLGSVRIGSPSPENLGSLDRLYVGFQAGDMYAADIRHIVNASHYNVIPEAGDDPDPLDPEWSNNSGGIWAEGYAAHWQFDGSVRGGFDLADDLSHSPLAGTNLSELESRTNSFLSPDGLPIVNNDSADAPQYLGKPDVMMNSLFLDGRMEGLHLTDPWGRDVPDDTIDYYAVGLFGGQNLRASLLDPGTGLGLAPGALAVGLIDPDGHMVDTWGYAADTNGDTLEMDYTASIPGTYLLVVANVGDVDFDGTTDGGEGYWAMDYRLQVDGAGPTALGGMRVGGDWVGRSFAINLAVQDNEAGVGVLDTKGAFIQVGVEVPGGIRSFNAGEIGRETDTGYPTDGLFFRYDGDMGGVRSEGIASVYLDVTGDIPVVETGGNSHLLLYADNDLGIVRVKNEGNVMGGSVLAAGVDDQLGNAIDVIDVSGSFGTLHTGPVFVSAGTDGNVRFAHVGGDIIVNELGFNEVLGPFRLDPGKSAEFVDDSGAEYKVSPTNLRVKGVGTTKGQIEYRYLPVNDTVGVAMVDLKNATGGGLKIKGQTAYTIEIGNLALPNANAKTSVTITGKPDVHIWHLDATQLKSFKNKTGGNVVTAEFQPLTTTEDPAVKIFQIDGSLGFAPASTSMEVQGPVLGYQSPETGYYPLPDELRLGLFSMGDVGKVRVGGTIGAAAIEGSLKELTPNADGRDDPGLMEGVSGVIYVAQDVDRIRSFGEGMNGVGNGALPEAGWFAGGTIKNANVDGREIADFHQALIAQGGFGKVSFSKGAHITSVDHHAVGGGQLPRLSLGANEFDDVLITNLYYQFTGTIESLKFRGTDTGMTDGFAAAHTMKNVVFSGGTAGIVNNSHLRASAGGGALEKLTVDGPGILDSTIALGGHSKKINVKKGGAIGRSNIEAADYIQKIIAPELMGSEDHPVTFNAPNFISNVHIKGNADRVAFYQGGVETLMIDGTASNIIVKIAGPMDNVKIGEDLVNFYFQVLGPQRGIGNIDVKGSVTTNLADLWGALPVPNFLDTTEVHGTIRTGGDFLADIDVRGNGNTVVFNRLQGGGLVSGDFDINGGMNLLRSEGDMGQVGDTMFIDGVLEELFVGSLTLNANLTATGGIVKSNIPV